MAKIEEACRIEEACEKLINRTHVLLAETEQLHAALQGEPDLQMEAVLHQLDEVNEAAGDCLALIRDD